jgi:hypothetical protein
MDPENDEPTPGWMKMSTVLVYLLVIAAFAYIFMSYMSQQSYFDLMDQLVNGDDEARASAIKALKDTDDSLPHVCSVLTNGVTPANRLACADIILARLEVRRPDVASLDAEDRKAAMRRGVDMFSVTKALLDENPKVRAKARQIVELTGTVETYQQARLDDSSEFEALIEKLRTSADAERTDMVEEFRQIGERGINFLVGAVFSDDPEFRLRGLSTLRVVMNDILRGSNQKRVVLVLGRRRCQLLIREMLQMKPENRDIVLAMLNISERVPQSFFDDMIKDLQAQAEASGGKLPLSATRDYVLELEDLEKVRAAEVPSEAIEDMSHDTE